MSRNFELLAQIEIERESGAEVRRSRLTSNSAATQVLGVGDTRDVGRDEMLRLVQSVFLANSEGGPRQVVFCSVDDEAASSSVCASAARTLAASSGRSVCLVDANLRSPHLTGVVGVKDMPFAVTSDSLRGQCQEIGENLWFAGASFLAGNSLALPPHDELKSRLAGLSDVFDFVLIDAPETNASGDAQVLGQIADAAILVIEASSTRRLTARKAKQTLDAAGVRLLGTVLRNRTFPIPGPLYRKL